MQVEGGRVDWLALGIASIERQCPSRPVPVVDAAVTALDLDPDLCRSVRRERERHVVLWQHPAPIEGGAAAVSASLALLERGIELSFDGIDLAIAQARFGVARGVVRKIEMAFDQPFPDTPEGVLRTLVGQMFADCLDTAREALRTSRAIRRDESDGGRVSSNSSRMMLLITDGESLLGRAPGVGDARLRSRMRARLRVLDRIEAVIVNAIPTPEAFRDVLLAGTDPATRQALHAHEEVEATLRTRDPGLRLPVEMISVADERLMMGVTQRHEAAGGAGGAALVEDILKAIEHRDALIARANSRGIDGRLAVLTHHLAAGIGEFDGLQAALDDLEESDSDPRAAPPPPPSQVPRRRHSRMDPERILLTNLERLHALADPEDPQRYRDQLVAYAGRVLSNRTLTDPTRCLYHGRIAINAYRDALGLTDRSAQGRLWATLWHNLGRMHQRLAVLDPDAGHVRMASEAFAQAAEVFLPESEPWACAALCLARREADPAVS